MGRYLVDVIPTAQKELKWLSPAVVGRIYPRLENLSDNPRPAGCKKLKGGESEWRMRVGDYRVIYMIDDARRLVQVTTIRHRSEVYEP